MPYFHSTACLELWFIRSLACRGHFLSAVLKSLHRNTDWREEKGKKESNFRRGRRPGGTMEIDGRRELSEHDVLNRKPGTRCYCPQERVSCSSQWFLGTGHKNNQGQADFWRKRCHCTSSARQAPDDARLSPPAFEMYPLHQAVEGILITGNLSLYRKWTELHLI